MVQSNSALIENIIKNLDHVNLETLEHISHILLLHDQGKYKYSCETITSGKILYRGTQKPKKLGTGPWWFAEDERVAYMFADGRGSAGEFRTSHYGGMDTYKTTKSLKLIKLDDRKNIVKLRRDIKDRDALTGLGNMIRFYKGKEFYGLHKKRTTDTDILTLDLFRSSTNPGYDGFHTDRQKGDGLDLGWNDDMFFVEFVICDPKNKVKIVKSEWIELGA